MQRMPKALFVFLCCLFLGLSTLSAQQKATVNHGVSLRGDPSTANPPIGHLDKNEKVTLLAKRPRAGFYHVQTADGIKGWIGVKYLTVGGQASRVPTPSPTPGASPGENATVCGIVASTHYASSSRRAPTFVNLDKPYPNQPFTILIWGEDLAKFDPKPTTWDGKRVCATGTISSYQGRPEIVAKEPGQIRVQ